MDSGSAEPPEASLPSDASMRLETLIQSRKIPHAAENRRGPYINIFQELDAGADVNAVDAYGKTALMLAAESLGSYRKLDIIKLLLKSGAGPGH
jgi:ankyrin repeat protein